MVKGTSRMRAKVCANTVLPEPVGPISRMFDFASSTLIMDRDREHLLGVILTDDIVVKNFAYFLRGRNAVARLHHRGLVLLVDDVHAQFDALVADEHGRAGDELAHLVLALAAERAVERILGIATADLAHLRIPTRYKIITAVTRRPNQARTRSRRSTTRRRGRWRHPCLINRQ